MEKSFEHIKDQRNSFWLCLLKLKNFLGLTE